MQMKYRLEPCSFILQNESFAFAERTSAFMINTGKNVSATTLRIGF